MKLITIIISIIISISTYAQSVSIEVSGECGMCKTRIESAALSTIGVSSADYDLEDKKLTVSYAEGLFNISELHQNIANVGHDTDLVKANDDVYDSMPMCCQYRAVDNGELIGMVFERENDKLTTLIGASVYWLGSDLGTTTGLDGDFKLPMSAKTDKLIISYVGYKSDTLIIEKPGTVDIILDNSVLLNAVEVVYKRSATEFSFIDPIKTKKISRKELTKAACCNLSESFETNPSVDVAFTDAVTGTKQIEMLGLAGPYVQITREGMPDIRGLSALDGFTYIPGPWIEGIQMNFGTGSVINGFESVAGQINVELKKPHDEEKLHVNGYGNLNGRLEANVISTFDVTDKLGSAIFLHANARTVETDVNDDNFVDNPISRALIVGNRWKYEGGNGHEGMFGFKSTFQGRESGTLSSITNPNDQWIANNDVTRHEVWLKRGVVFEDRPYASLGFMLSGTLHDLKSNYGARRYDGSQKMLYANLLYSTILGDTNNKIVFGASFQGEQYDETFSDLTFARNEYVPGAFAEYSYSIVEKFDLVLGMRADYNNYYGLFATPRLHARYAPNENHVFRVVGGRGQRTANIFAENVKAMASNRRWIVNSQPGDNPYGLEAEVAWNTGLNYTYLLDVKGKVQTLSLDYYYTNFQNQVVVDYDQDPQEFHVYNLDGESYSHSLQSQLDLSLFEGFDLRLAYRYNIVNTTLNNQLQWKPLTSKHRSFANLAYETKNGWKFDYTVNLIGPKRLPNTELSPAAYRLESESPSFWMHNAQVSKLINDKLEFYLGGENLANFKQQNPIVSADNPNGDFFDASMVWGPIFGRNIYLGFRYILKKDE